MILTTERSRTLIIAGAASLATIVVLSVFLSTKLSEYRVFLDTRSALLERAFLDASLAADRTEAVKESTERVKDCAVRGEFDALLDRLGSLSRTEYTRLTTIYPLCADYYYRLKLFHIDRLDDIQREYNAYRESAAFVYRADETWNAKATSMAAVLKGERERGDAMKEQVVLQEDYIKAVAAGTKDDPALSERVTLVGTALTEADKIVDDARAALEKSMTGS
jgi:hypothetical protein